MSVFVEAIGRNEGEDLQRSHLYREIGPNDYLPMCQYGWNRSDGASFSIFRGHSGRRGLCKICQRRRKLDLPGVEARPGSHRTKWL